MQIIDTICFAILALTAFMAVHKTIYSIIGIFITRKTYPETDKLYRYAVVISARNEQNVIGNLIDSIRSQNYDASLISIFVVADNCTDGTASICRDKGAIVYERFCPEKARKGYALSFLVENIKKDYGIVAFDGYFVFDADNLLGPDYITEMNKAFAAGNEVVTSYRNIKNFSTNIVSSAYGIHFYRNSMAMHRPRSFLSLGTHLTGTGYLISGRLLQNGWNFTNLTEDDELTNILCAGGNKVAYCDADEFFDEQPVDFRTQFRQRVRWARGRLVCFYRYGFLSYTSIIKHRSFTCYDMFTHYFPFGLVTLLMGIIYPLCGVIYKATIGGGYDFQGMGINLALWFGGQYLYFLFTGTLAVIKERRRIHCGLWKLVFYLLIFPWFDLMTLPIFAAAVFKDVQWLPIEHNDAKRVEEIN